MASNLPIDNDKQMYDTTSTPKKRSRSEQTSSSSVESQENNLKQVCLSKSPISPITHTPAAVSVNMTTPSTTQPQGQAKPPDINYAAYPNLPAWAPDFAMLLRVGITQDIKQEIHKEIESIKHSLEFTAQTAKEAKDCSAINTLSINKLESVVMEKTSTLSKEYEMLNKKILDLETRSRRNNLKFAGITITAGENLTEWLRSFTQTTLNLEEDYSKSIEIERIHRFGPQKDIVVKFLRYKDREILWSRRKLLKDTDVSMYEDFPEVIQKERRTLYPYMKIAQEKGKVAFLQVNKLIVIDGSNNRAMYMAIETDLKKLAIEFPRDRNKMNTKDGYTCFFGEECPLSNFCPSPFELDDIPFVSEEQHLQYSKAMFFKQEDIAKEIMKTEDPRKQKQLGRKVKPFDQPSWHQAAPDIVVKGLTAKFSQNQDLLQILKDTGKNILVECAPNDKFFGIGLGLYHRNRTNEDRWQGQNIMGKALMIVRRRLSQDENSMEDTPE
jgi:ribA/ribD-fused uncharacterized protein